MLAEAVIERPPGVGRMLTWVRAWCRAATWTESFSQVWMITSPAKLLTSSRAPRATGTVSSVCGGALRGAAACASTSVRTTLVSNIVSWNSTLADERHAAAEEGELALPRLRQMAVEIH